jgi:stage V sporulation protein R
MNAVLKPSYMDIPRGERLPHASDWNFELIESYFQAIKKTADRFKLDCYPTQLEVITAEQMLDAYASVGMPVNYRHWSFGKQFITSEKSYRRGHMGLAYEIVINSDPCIAYLMEENTLPMQALVMAHACFGHNSFFKGNYLFRMWTDASSIIDYLVYAKSYIAECEERHGIDAVEEVLDACHALMNYGVDRYRRPQKISMVEEEQRRKDREAYLQQQVNDLWRTLPRQAEKQQEKKTRRYPEEPQENILYFIEKNAPLLEPWQREVVRIVRKVAQYFYPQRQTQVMNEGWATFWHYTLLNTMYDAGQLADGFMIEWLSSHTNVVFQPPVTDPRYSGINPYALGFAMFTDLKRICLEPTQEDREWFPDFAGSGDWLKTLDYAMRHFKDESFIGQYLSPKLMRDFRFFNIVDDASQRELEVAAIHDDLGYKRVREALSKQYDLNWREPNIQVWNVNLRGDRSLTLRHLRQNDRPLDNGAEEVVKHVARLWGFRVRLESVDSHERVLQHWEVTPPPPL